MKIFKIILILMLLVSISFSVLGGNTIMEFRVSEQKTGLPEFPSKNELIENSQSRIKKLEISVKILEVLVNQLAIQNGIKIERFDDGLVKISQFE